MTRRYPYQFVDFNQPLVDPATGRVTPYFQRQLFGQTENAEDVSDQVDTFAAAITALQNDKADKATLINTGFGLSGGGDLSGDRTLALGNPALVDPEADRILFWDDSEGELRWLTIGANLTITDDTISASGGGGGGGGDFILPTATTLPLTVGSPGIIDFNDRCLFVGDLPNPCGPTGRGVAVSGDVDVIAYVEGLTDVNFNSAGLFMSDGTRYVWNAGLQVSGYVRAFEIWDTQAVFNSQLGNRNYGGGNIANWFRLTHDAATGISTAFASYDGLNWFQIGPTTNWLSAGVVTVGVGAARNNFSLSPTAYVRSFEVV